jgi:D-glycero-alpha-D-manno-heptose-7-phosphate kinase
VLITKTPLRISFFGGGTDYPEYFEHHGGAVLATAIDKSIYLSATRFYSRLFDYSIRIAYRKVECVRGVDQIEHGPFRECLRWAGITENIEVDTAADLPAFSGLGSSSSFVVGLLNTLTSFQGRRLRPIELAYRAIEIERGVLHESVGCQDQTVAAVGGFNLIEFRRTDDIVVHRLPLGTERVRELEAHLLMVFTGIKRRAADMAAEQIGRIPDNGPTLQRMRAMVDDGYDVLMRGGGLSRFGELLHEAWALKGGLSAGVSNGAIAEIYDAGRSAGAWGGKLLGAGGGGFMLFVVPPERRAAVRDRLAHLEEVPVLLNAPGSHVIYA